MTTFDRDSWEQRWETALRTHADVVATRPPSPHLLTEAGDLPPGRALDAGCGHGAETLWLAARGWHVTAVDFAEAALEHGRAHAEALGDGTAARITWTPGDLTTWTPPAGRFDLVVCLYVHGAVEDLVRRLGGGVAPGGTLLLVGHRPIDPATGRETAAAGQTQVSVEEAVAALPSPAWEIRTAVERPRAAAGTGVDAVVRARRLTGPGPG